MDTVKTWTVRIEIAEHEGRTRAVARLHTGDTEHTVGVGFARLNPRDRDVPEIGDELAVCRALAGLTHDLLEASIADIKQNDPASAHGDAGTNDAWT